jgi:ectoine hydroxylase-related dioxygenase (phytanoyl-CoA dioxygenase family)
MEIDGRIGVGTAMLFRDESLQRLFEEQGFVTVPLLSPDEVAAVRERFFDIYNRRDAGADSLGLKQGYHVSLDHPDRDYRRQAEALVREILAPRAAALLRGYRFLLGAFLLKPSGAGPLAVHRDWTMTADPLQTSLNCWCPLVDVDGRNGALALLPGSHACLPDNVHGPGMAQYLQFDPQRLMRLSHIVPLKAGEAVLFDYRMLHGSMPNTTLEARPAIGAGFVPETARPMLHVRDAADGRGYFA